jgi:hypothetical protein
MHISYEHYIVPMRIMIYIYTHQDIHMIIIDPYRKHIMIQMIKNHIIDMISRHP